MKTSFISSDEEDNIDYVSAGSRTEEPRDLDSQDSLSSRNTASQGDSDNAYRDYFLEPTNKIKQVIHCPKGKRRGPRGGVVVPFPVKLYAMLEGVEKEGLEHVVAWQPHGRCFIVHKSKEFVDHVMPRYFRQSKLTSFQRQLNLYGFMRLTSGRDRGGYFHELFLKGRPDLCKIMLRTRVKGNGIKAGSVPDTEPNFYAMPFCKERKRVHIKESPKDAYERYEPEPYVPLDQPESRAESGEVLTRTDLSMMRAPMMFEEPAKVSPVPFSAPTVKIDGSRPLPCPPPLQNFAFPSQARVRQTSLGVFPEEAPSWSPQSRRVSQEMDDDCTGFFAGHTFQCMDEGSLEAFETSLIRNI
jgi:hypothetical protein